MLTRMSRSDGVRANMSSSPFEVIPPRYFFSFDSISARHSSYLQHWSATSTIKCPHDLSTHFAELPAVSQKMGVQGACERRRLCSNSATR